MDIELLVFDEAEYFHDYDDPLFNYPYINRKQILESFKMNFESLIDPTITKNSIYREHIKFKKSDSCLEEPYLN